MLVETVDNIEIHFEALPEDVPVRGNAVASGDDELDKQTEDQIIKRLNDGDIFAWFTAKVWAEKNGVEGGPEYLGCCCYKDQDDFCRDEPGYYFRDMKRRAIESLKEQISNIDREDHVLVILENGIVQEIWSEQSHVKVTILDIDNQADDPIYINEEMAEVPEKGIEAVIQDKENKFNN